MPISIECILESAVFFPGDTIFCRIFITNLGGSSSGSNDNNKQIQREQSISWITAQVYGNVIVESSFIKLNSSNKNNKKKIKQQQQQQSTSSTSSNNQTQQPTQTQQQNQTQQQVQQVQQAQPNSKYSLTTGKRFTAGVSSATSLPNLSEIGDNGKPIFTSPTTFLASELYIPPGQTKSFIYYLTLPSPLPPSFKGTSLKYSYFLSIASQVFTNPAQILTVPIRILTPASALRPIKFKSNMNFDFEEGSAETTQEYSSSKSNLEVVSKWPISPYKKSQYFPLPYPQNISQFDSNNTKKSVIDILNKYSSPSSIVISKGTDKLATFSICKTAFSLGDSVHGTFDFSIATIPCFKILIKLECEEIVDSKYLQSTRGSNKPIRKLYGELHEFTTNIRQTHFMFHIPVEASQEFSTKYVSVKWSLRFEFVTPIKSSFIPYQAPPTQAPPTLTNSSRSNSNNNLPILITPPNSNSLPTTPVISPIKSNNTTALNDSTSSVQSIPKNRSFTDVNNHSRNNSVDNLNQHHNLQINHHNYHHGSSSSSHKHNNSNSIEHSRDYYSGKDDDEYGGGVDNGDNSSSHSENAIINDDTLSNSSSSFSSSTTNTSRQQQQQQLNQLNSSSSSNSLQNSQNINIMPKKKKLYSHPIIGVLKDDGTLPLVDTLHWSLPIRVLVGFPPHELLHTNKNELIL